MTGSGQCWASDRTSAEIARNHNALMYLPPLRDRLLALLSTGIARHSVENAVPSQADDAALTMSVAWPRLVLAGALALGAGFAAAWLTTITCLVLLPSGATELPTYVGPLWAAVGFVGGFAVFLGVSRSLRQEFPYGTAIWNRPPGFVFGLTVWLVCIWSAYLLTDIDSYGNVFLSLATLVALFVMSIVWLVRLLVLLNRRRFALTSRSVAQWLLGPVALVTLAAFNSWDAASHSRFHLSNSAITADARQVLASVDEDLLATRGRQHIDHRRRVGILDIDWVDVRAECTAEGHCDPATAAVEYEIHSEVFTSFTYVYSPSGEPHPSPWGIEHLGGNWWLREHHH